MTRARRITAFLEDRRILYNPTELETPHHCVESVLEIRHFLTSEIGGLDENDALAVNLRAMRAACRKFLDTVQDNDQRIVTFGMQHGHYASWTFLPAIGELRAIFGLQIGIIAVRYGLEVEKNLAVLLPVSTDYKDERNRP